MFCKESQKKRHLSFDCPPKHENKPYKNKNEPKYRREHAYELATNVNEFAGSATYYIPNQSILPNYKSPSFVYNYQLQIMKRICKQSPNLANINFQEIIQYLHNNDPRFNIYKKKLISFFMAHFNKISQRDLITIIWAFSHLHSNYIFKNTNRYRRTPHVET